MFLDAADADSEQSRHLARTGAFDALQKNDPALRFGQPGECLLDTVKAELRLQSPIGKGAGQACSMSEISSGWQIDRVFALRIESMATVRAIRAR
jgi:hypothetical protein